MALVGFVRKAAGTGIGIVGVVLWVLAGLFCLVWTLYVLFLVLGPLGIILGLVFAPVTYVASIFIVWFTTGIFPLLLLVPYVASWVGIILASVGSSVRGE